MSTPSTVICAVYLHRSGRSESTAIRFWAQVLGAKTEELKMLVRNCEQMSTPTGRSVLKGSPIYNTMEELKSFHSKQIKRILDESRK